MRGRGATLFRDISLEGGRCARKEALNLALLRVQREALSKSLSEVSERARERRVEPSWTSSMVWAFLFFRFRVSLYSAVRARDADG